MQCPSICENLEDVEYMEEEVGCCPVPGTGLGDWGSLRRACGNSLNHPSGDRPAALVVSHGGLCILSQLSGGNFEIVSLMATNFKVVFPCELPMLLSEPDGIVRTIRMLHDKRSGVGEMVTFYSTFNPSIPQVY